MSGKCKSILFFVGEGSFFVSHRLNLAKGAIDAGYHVTVACPNHPDAIEAIHLTGANWVEWQVNRGGTSIFGEARAFLNALAVIRRMRPTVIHAIGIKCILHAGMASKFWDSPIVAAVSGLGYVYTGDRGGIKRVLRWAINVLLHLSLNRRNVSVIFQNSDDARMIQFAHLNRASVHLIGGSGVDLTKITMRPHPIGNGTRIGLPARLLRDKGVYEFVEAARELQRRGREISFLLIGDPDPANPTSVKRAELEAWAREGAVEWLPHTKDMGEVLSTLHIVTLPSYREGFPKTLIDAAAAGRAVVASDVPGCRDAVVDGVTGLLCTARDSLALANAIDKLVCNREACTLMGAAARAHAERHFDIEAVTDAHLKIYRERTSSDMSC